VASVNIDQKLIVNPNAPSNSNAPSLSSSDTVELQNGCACCSLADELLDSVTQLTANRDRPLDAIVVELSGVADPNVVRENWGLAMDQMHPATMVAEMGSVVTLVDSCTFGSDWMTYDSFGDRDGWVEEGDDCAAERKVPELLAEQVEAADVLLINKVDLAVGEEVQTAMGVAKSLNDDAEVYKVQFGNIGVDKILGKRFRKDEAKVKEETKCTTPDCADPDCDEHNAKEADDCKDPKCTDTSHDHSHDHAAPSDCTEPGCTDTSHDHSHDHAESSDCTTPGCTDTTHDHSHNNAESTDCTDPGCTDTSHDHSHDNAESTDCADPGCTDTTHSHTHSHASSPTSTANLGISNFVFRSPTPFHPPRLMALLNSWPVPIKSTLDLSSLAEAASEGYDVDSPGVAVRSPFTGVIRSKGFCWMAPGVWSGKGEDSWRHDTAMFWSHAGKHFGISTAGKWWGTVSKDQMKSFFPTNMREYDRILAEDWASEEFGDRRQELVFIGVKIDEAEITEALNDCLCTDEEMAEYRQELRNREGNTFTTTAVDMEGTREDGPSLFDVGGSDHMDSDVNIRGD